MELGHLTLMCVNLVCVSAAGILVLWALMHIQAPGRRHPRIYDRPHLPGGRSTAGGWHKQEETLQRQ